MKQKGQEGDGGMPLLFVKEDITKMKVDAIVNAANTELRMAPAFAAPFSMQQARKR